MLAFACAFTMFASAAFTDSADIKATEAVDTLTALGIIDGYSDGSFKPNGTVTRAEMAKMIFVLWNGGKSDASAYQSMNSAFADTKNHWAAGYVNFCASNHIIAGKSASTFAPNATVTGQEAAKMLLVVAGYDPAKAGLTGPQWAQNTMSYAGLAGLFDDVDSPVEQALPRQYAAQMIYNALDVNRVKWSTDSNSFDEIQAWSGSGFTKETLGSKYMDLVRDGKDVDDALYLIGTKKEDGRDTYSLNTTGNTYIRVKGDYSDLVGQRIVVMHKKGKVDQVYGVSAYVDSKVLASGFVGQVEKDGTDKIKLDGTSYKVYNNNADTVAVAYFDNNSTGEKMNDLFAMAKDDGTALQNNVARSIKLIDNNGDGKVEAVVSSPVKFGKVTYVGSSSITVDSGIGSLKFDDATVYDGIKKDDYVYVTDESYNSSDKDVVTKADITSAEIAATRTGTSGNVVEARVDGKWYRLANGVTVKSGSTYDMVLCGKYILNAEETKGSLEDVAFLYQVATTTSSGSVVADVDTGVGSKKNEGTVKARMYFADGSNAEVKLSKYDGKKLVTSATTPDANQVKADDVLITSGASAKGLVTFTKLSDDTYDIEFVSTTNKAGCDDYITTGSVKVDDKKIDNKPVNDDAVIYVEASTEIKVISGKSIKNWDNKTADSTVLLTNEKNGLDYVAAGYVEVSGAKVPGATADTKYGYLTRDGYTVTVNGEKKAAYEVWTNEGAKTLVEDASAPIAGATTGKVISYTIDGDYINDVSLEGLDAAIIGTDRTEKGTAKIATGGAATTGTYTFDDDCVFVAVDDSENEGAEGGIEAIPTAQKCVGSNYVANAIVVLKNDGTVATPDYKIVAVFYDVDNMLDRNTDTDTVVTDSHVHFAG